MINWKNPFDNIIVAGLGHKFFIKTVFQLFFAYSGRIQGTVHRDLLKDYEAELQPGTVVVFRQVSFYTPGIYAEGYIVFVFPFVRSSVRNFVPFVELLQSIMFKQIKWSRSHQPLIRKHSYLDHGYPGESAFIPRLLTPGSMPREGLEVKN